MASGLFFTLKGGANVDIARFTDYKDKIVNSVSKAIVGKEREIEMVINSFVCSGHVLLEDGAGHGQDDAPARVRKVRGRGVPAHPVHPLTFLPSDLTGINFYNQKLGEFEFRKGPLFSDVVLADEINRATPRTQSSLLEAMEERQITVDGVTYPLGAGLHGHGDPESPRELRHIPAAGGADRPLASCGCPWDT